MRQFGMKWGKRAFWWAFGNAAWQPFNGGMALVLTSIAGALTASAVNAPWPLWVMFLIGLFLVFTSLIGLVAGRLLPRRAEAPSVVRHKFDPRRIVMRLDRVDLSGLMERPHNQYIRVIYRVWNYTGDHIHLKGLRGSMRTGTGATENSAALLDAPSFGVVIAHGDMGMAIVKQPAPGLSDAMLADGMSGKGAQRGFNLSQVRLLVEDTATNIDYEIPVSEDHFILRGPIRGDLSGVEVHRPSVSVGLPQFWDSSASPTQAWIDDV